MTSVRRGAEPYRLPEVCPVCGAPVVRDEDGAFLRCTGAECPAQLSRNIAHFVSRDAMDIEGLGSAIVEGLIDKGLYFLPGGHLLPDPGGAEGPLEKWRGQRPKSC